MQLVAKALGAVAILAIVACPLLFMSGSLSLDGCKGALLGATCLWFAAALAARAPDKAAA